MVWLTSDGSLRTVVFVSQNQRPDVFDQGHRVWDHHRDVLFGVGQVVEVHHDELEAVKFSLVKKRRFRISCC